ncbi:5-oxoprolinase subunit PxpA [soil metagenome]
MTIPNTIPNTTPNTVQDTVQDTTRHVDINADSGESFGRWRLGRDEELFPKLTSANLACGFHAGDPLTMQRTVRLAKEHGVKVGAHPGFPDLAGFGRRDMAVAPEALHADVIYQIGALRAFLYLEGLELHHVKAHGALYLKMTRDRETALAVAEAVRAYDPGLPLVILGGPGGGVMAAAAREAGLRAVQEAFPDRAYLADGRLAPRSMAGAVIREPAVVAARSARMVTQGRVEALDGGVAEVAAQTLCLHGDNPEAPEIARAVREALREAGVGVQAF